MAESGQARPVSALANNGVGSAKDVCRSTHRVSGGLSQEAYHADLQGQRVAFDGDDAVANGA
jgi:hypothetical protein